MPRVFALYRVLMFRTGETQALLVGAYEHGKDAVKARNERQAALDTICGQGRVSVGATTEFGLAQLLEDIGIDSISHAITEVQVQGPDLISPSGIILPGDSRH